MRFITREGAGRGLRFLVGGAINTAFTYAVYLLLKIIIPYQWAYFMAYALGVIFSYWFNARWVFRVPLSWRRLFSYPIVYVLQYLLSALCLGVLVEKLGVSVNLAPICVVVALLPITYLMNHFVLLFGAKAKGGEYHDWRSTETCSHGR